jgi:hypothetical protein
VVHLFVVSATAAGAGDGVRCGAVRGTCNMHQPADTHHHQHVPHQSVQDTVRSGKWGPAFAHWGLQDGQQGMVQGEDSGKAMGELAWQGALSQALVLFGLGT